MTAGLDYGKRRHAACRLDETGDFVAELAFVNSRKVPTAFSARFPGATFVKETGTHSPLISRLLTGLNLNASVASISGPPVVIVQTPG